MYSLFFHRLLALEVFLFSLVGFAEELEPLKIAPSHPGGLPYDGMVPKNFEWIFQDESPPLVPKGTALVSKNKPVTSSCKETFRGNLAQITDGIRSGETATVFLEGGLQWVQIDLLKEYSVYVIKVWRCYRMPTIYFDVIVMVSNDPEFTKGTTIIFNNDDDNSTGFGKGNDKAYIDGSYGKLFKANGIKVRYMRFYSDPGDFLIRRDTFYLESTVFTG